MRVRHLLLLPAVLLIACAGEPADQISFVPDAPPVATETSAASSISVANDHHPVSIPALMEKEFDGRDLTLGQVLSRTNTYTRYAITYKSGELTISGIMNIPVGDGPFPVIITNHGYIEPSVYTIGRGLKREQDYYASRGYAVLHPDYRNHAGSSKDPENDVKLRFGYIEDVINAIYAIRSSNIPQLDGERIGMIGHSMGGGVTLGLLTARPDLVDAAVLYAAVSGDARRNFDRWMKNRPEVAGKIEAAYGTAAANPEFWDNASAQTFLDRITAPVLIIHGDRDADVPVEWSRELEAELKNLGKDVTYNEYANEGHEFGAKWGVVMKDTIEFFDRELRS